MKAHGFTLLEVLLATTLLGIGLSAIFAGFSGSLRNVGRLEDWDRRVDLSRQKFAELDLLKKIRPADSASGQFGDGTRWSVQSSPFIASVSDGVRSNPASIIRLDVTLEWLGRNGIQRRTIQTYRYQLDDGMPIPALEEQLRGLQ